MEVEKIVEVHLCAILLGLPVSVLVVGTFVPVLRKHDESRLGSE
jgi:hypothetical protein